MADILGIGTLAANSYKRAIEVTSHNVANIGTEGYSRQSANLTSNTPHVNSSAYLSGGVKVDMVTRSYAPYIQDQLVSSNSMKDRYDQQLQLAKQLEGVVASNDEGVQEFMQRYFDALQNLADNPTSNVSGQLVVDEMGNMHSHIENVNVILKDTHNQVNSEIEDSVSEINSRLDIVQTINEQVSRAYNGGTQLPNDLLDQRDQAILELSSYLDVKTFHHADGEISVHTSDGRLPLVSDRAVQHLTAANSEYQDENRTSVFMEVTGKRINVESYISGGSLGGTLDFRSNMLDPAMNEMGLMLNGMVAATNWQHYQGWDSNSDAGASLFEPLQGNVIKHSDNNLGSDNGAGISVSFTPQRFDGASYNTMATMPPYIGGVDANGVDRDQPATYQDKLDDLSSANRLIGEFKPREYEMRYDSQIQGFQVYDRDTRESLGEFTLNDDPTLLIDGLEFKMENANYNVGDIFIVKPHQDMIDQFARVLDNPKDMATRGQSPYDADTGNPLDPAITLPAPASVGDNVNVANLASLQSKSILYSNDVAQPSESLLGGYSKMATNVGMYVRGTEVQLTAQTNVYDNIVNRRESVSGVNLDEEAANLMRYQQAYEASAQIIQTAQQMFTTLLSAVRG